MKYREISFVYRSITLFCFCSFVVVVLYFSYAYASRHHHLRTNPVVIKEQKDDEIIKANKWLSLNVTWPKKMESFSPDFDFYPQYKNLLQIVTDWNPDIPDVPAHFTETLQHFDYSNPDERAIAEQFRSAELPFKLYNVPEIVITGIKWTDEYLTRALSHHTSHAEKSKNNHFMYWVNRGGSLDPDYTSPTDVVKLSFKEWLQKAKYAEEQQLSNSSSHYYFMTSALNDELESFITKDLSLFSTKKENFFITNVAANKGTQCRFGMRGIISEAHYDTGRNMVAMIRGGKRYILNPPKACHQLGIITDRKHPSYRHSVIDWSDVKQAEASGFAKVPAIDTVVREGEVLYIPSFWFHYIVSLGLSIQCNSRSGTPPLGQGKKDIDACMGKTENYDGYNTQKNRGRRKKKRRGESS